MKVGDTHVTSISRDTPWRTKLLIRLDQTVGAALKARYDLNSIADVSYQTLYYGRLRNVGDPPRDYLITGRFVGTHESR